MNKIKITGALILILELILTFIITFIFKNFIILFIGLIVSGITYKIIDLKLNLYEDKLKQENHDNLEKIAKNSEK